MERSRELIEMPAEFTLVPKSVENIRTAYRSIGTKLPVPESIPILEKLYGPNPEHPGTSHFLIHAYDYPPLADKGLPAARRHAEELLAAA